MQYGEITFNSQESYNKIIIKNNKRESFGNTYVKTQKILICISVSTVVFNQQTEWLRDLLCSSQAS